MNVHLPKVHVPGPRWFNVLLRVAGVLTLLALALMVWSVIQPTPMPVLLAMSLGQLLGTLAFAMYGLVVFADLRRQYVRRKDAASTAAAAAASEAAASAAPATAAAASTAATREPVAGAGDGADPGSKAEGIDVKLAVAALFAMSAGAASATAEPLRLRGDALASSPSPVGLLVLDGSGSNEAGVSAEAMVWLGAGEDGADGDALVIAVVARRADGRAEARLGRFVTTAGALRPIHLDGAAARLRLPYRLDAEVFGGVPVIPRLGAHAWDWIVGGRVGRRLGDWGGAGVALLERRDRGYLAARELGLDASAALGKADLAGRVAIDLADPGLADLTLTARHRVGAWRAELTAEHRVASHLVPATSLFSVLGDVASERLAGAVRWRAAPRLDLLADVGARRLDGELAADGLVRATLRLDERGKGALSAELRRTGVVDGGWLGARVAARVPRGPFTASLEGELVLPDEDRGRGTVWPWGLAALGWSVGDWDAAIACEAASTPSDRFRLDVLAQLGRRWEVR